MRWFWVCVAALGLSACGTTKFNLENQALIQVQQGAIIYEIDGDVVYSALSQREQAVAPGEHEILVTRFGDIRADRGVYRLTVAAGLTYQIAKDRRSVKVVDTAGATVDELFLSLTDRRTFVSRSEHQRNLQAQETQLQGMTAAQKILAAEKQQKKIESLPLIRKVGAQICQQRQSVKLTGAHLGFTGTLVYVGYVEGMTDEKIQIRIARAFFAERPSVSPEGFSSSTVIWDDPMNWDLCQ